MLRRSKGGSRAAEQKKKIAEELVFKLEPIRKIPEFAAVYFPDMHPEQNVMIYLQSKMHTAEQLAELAPDNVAGPCIELQSRKRMLELADRRLKNIRMISIDRKENLAKEWRTVNNLQVLLRTSTLTFENFIKENMEKRERAEKKVNEEIAIQNVRKENINTLVYHMRRLYEVKKIFESHIRAFKLYENYLQKVVTISEFKDVDKVMQRFGALQEAKVTAFKKSQEMLNLIEENMLSLRHKHEENGFLIIGKKNKLNNLSGRYSEAVKNALLWESTVTKVWDQCVNKYEDRNTIRQVSRTLYELMCRRKGEAGRKRKLLKDHDNHDENQMIAISNTLLQMDKIMRVIKEATIEEEKRPVIIKGNVHSNVTDVKSIHSSRPERIDSINTNFTG